MQAAEALKWPTRIIYPNIPAAQRRAFERSYQDLLFLQAEYVHCPSPSLYPLEKGRIDEVGEKD